MLATLKYHMGKLVANTGTMYVSAQRLVMPHRIIQKDGVENVGVLSFYVIRPTKIVSSAMHDKTNESNTNHLDYILL